MTVGEKIKKERTQQGLTQKQLGLLCGIAEPTIRRYELGKLHPKLETIIKIASALKVPVENLLDMLTEFDNRYDAKKLSDEVSAIEKTEVIDKDAPILLSFFSQLNKGGRKKAIDYITDLAGIEKYTK